MAPSVGLGGLGVAVVAAAAVAAGVNGAPAGDLVPELPLWGPPPTKMYSGYLDAKGTPEAPGCAVTEKECKLHYWLALAEVDPSHAPVVLWLNGGPGSSSVLGMLQEQGPLLINASGGLMRNPYSWTKTAVSTRCLPALRGTTSTLTPHAAFPKTLVVLESPTGVGYSYCSTQVAGGVCKNTDKLTASAARAAVVNLFEKFPELSQNEFFVTGESYAGVYVPTLSKELLDHAKGQVNFKGLMVGDPCTDNTAQKDSMDMIWYGHKNGFVPDQEFDLLWNHCSMRAPPPISAGHWSWGEEGPNAFLERHHAKHHSLDAQRSRYRAAHEDDEAELPAACVLAYRKYLASTSRGFSQSWVNAYINNLSLFGASALVSFDLVGSLNYMTKQYMERADVRKALHVDTGPSKTWPSVAQGFDYTSEYDACNGAAEHQSPKPPSMIDFYREIAPQLDTTLVMNGDTDPCVSYEGTRTALTRVGFAEIDGGGYRPWFYNHTATTVAELEAKSTIWGPDLSLTAEGVQMGGSIVNYEHGLAFQTVHGAGHMVPQFRPQASLHQVSKVLLHQSFAPLLPLNGTLANMSDTQYDAALNKWTVTAKKAPYTNPFLV